MAQGKPITAATKIPMRTGRAMPVIGLGTWRLTSDTAGTVEEALNSGYRMIDTSGDYGTQPGIAEALRRVDVDRREVYLVTKVEEDEDAYEATRNRLRELCVDHVDLTLIHRPPAEGVGVDLWRDLQRARDDGLTIDIGVSNYSIDEIEALADASGEMPAVNQIEWTPFGWSRHMLNYCERYAIVIQAYSPLTRVERLNDRVLNEIARRYGRTPAQVLLRWNLQLGTVPLPKANDHGHLRANLQIFDFELDDDAMRRLENQNENYSALGPSLQYT